VKSESARMPTIRVAAIVCVSLLVGALAGCADASSSVERAKSRVTAKEKALTQAEADLTAAADTFCQESKTYIMALDRYGDVLNATAPTVGDVREAGKDLAEPKEGAFDGAEAAVDAHQQVQVAQRELADAQAALSASEAGTSGPAQETGGAQPTSTPLAPAAAVDRVKQAESEFASAQAAITPQTPLADASEQFNSAAVALEFAWLRLFVDAGCVSAEQKQQAEAALTSETTALPQQWTDAG
jgi:hypothetical protein